MYTEKKLLKQATFYCSKNSKNTVNLVDNKSFADTEVRKQRDRTIFKSPDAKMRQTVMNHSDDLMESKEISRMAFTSKPNQMNKANYFNTTISKSTPQKKLAPKILKKNKKRPISQAIKGMTDMNKVSIISNFRKCFQPDINDMKNLKLNRAMLNRRAQTKLVDIELGEPQEINLGTCVSRNADRLVS